MRILVRVLVGLAVLLAVLLVAVAVILPRVVQSDAVRARLAEAAADATGGRLDYAGLDVGLLPPRLVVEKPSVTAPDSDTPALAAERVGLRISLLPLLAGAVVVDSLRVEGASVRLERTDAGVAVPGLFPERPEEPKAAPRAEPPAPEDEELTLAVRRVDLEEARVELVDRTRAPAVTWVLQDVQGGLRGESLDAPLRLELGGRLASGGSLRADGDVGLDGAADLKLSLTDVHLAPLAPYAEVPKGSAFEGGLDGELALQREAEGAARVDGELRLVEADLATGAASLRGDVSLDLDVKGTPEAAAGRVTLDATAATLHVPDLLDKPGGTRARLEGPLQLADGAVKLEKAALVLGPLDGRLDLALGDRTRVRLEAPSFDVEGLDRLLLPLEGYPLRGAVRLDGFQVVTDPLAFDGQLVFEDVSMQRPGEPVVGLTGAMRGRKDGLVSQDLVVSVAGQAIPSGVRLLGLAADTPRLEVDAKAQDLDTAALMAAFGRPRDLLQGPLDLDADLAGPLPREGSLVEALRGRIVFEIAPGTLRGVSFLRSAFGGAGTAAELALLASQRKEKLERFYGDEFQRLGGTVQLADGVARSDDLRLDYGAYHVDLRGSVALEDLSLDLTGKITVEKEVDRALAGSETGGSQRVIPLAHVGGTLEHPEVRVTDEAMRGFAAAYVTDPRRREKWERKIDERLGEGAGKEVLRTLDDILRGGSKEDAP